MKTTTYKVTRRDGRAVSVSVPANDRQANTVEAIVESLEANGFGVAELPPAGTATTYVVRAFRGAAQVATISIKADGLRVDAFGTGHRLGRDAVRIAYAAAGYDVRS